ncbi:MAG: acylneuraminate cytidylyltransferase family protein [Leptonema illini]|uniref:Acylneuraminate cytidylyltransferase family protein n=1 Tax=Leptonema illini TaxID=183 RepID=A0A833H305_9LEPT|nr:MAG: acylneuraminate cytidylyltransferase family protein [Leptonema illini]PKN15929.1 MAG: acylneuraminate cytidylyltransferase family protein [Deltaproteobacteria bacterium HGW-Deltaproteobacteria-23]
MIDQKKVLAIIPARSGSKGLPGKNILPMNGKPLIAWTIEKARKSLYVDVVLVSTDGLEIASVAKEYGADVPFMRPSELASDTASTYDVIRHALSYFSESEHMEFDYIILLEPTSPLREDQDIDRMLEALHEKSGDFDAIVSIGQVTEHPSIMKRLVGDRLEPFCPDLSQSSRRQDNEPAFFPYGVGYIAKTATLLEENTFYARRCLSYPILRYQNYEIDDIYDFLCVESVMKHEWRLK